MSGDEAMPITPYGRHRLAGARHEDVVFDYGPHDLERIPVDHIHVLAHNAISRGKGYANFGGRRYDREALSSLRRDLDAGALPELDTCAFTTPAGDCDNPAIHGPWCPQHADED